MQSYKICGILQESAVQFKRDDIDCQCNLQATKPVRVAIDNKWDTAVYYIRKLFIESRSKAIFNYLTGANLKVYFKESGNLFKY